MKKIILSLIFINVFTASYHSQNVAINGSGALPVASAMLDVSAADKGVSFPNINLVSETDAVTIPAPITGLMIYNTNVAMPCGAGLYFNNGTVAAPVWTCFSKTIRNIHAYDNLGRASIISAVLTLQPGCTINVVIPIGQTADIKVEAYVGALAANAGTSAGLDAVIFLNGTFLAQGGWGREIISANTFGTITLTTFVSNLTAGSYNN